MTRQLELLLLLQAEGKKSVRELARQLEVSPRTVQRDLDALSAAGVPVVAERGGGGGWRLMEGYRTRLTGMTDAEWRALLLASGSPAADELGWSAELESALLKLRAVQPSASLPHASALQSRLLLDGEGWTAAEKEQPHLSLLMEAVLQDRRIRFRYASPAASPAPAAASSSPLPRERLACPLGLVRKGSSWYLVADELESGRPDSAPQEPVRKTFRVSRVLEARLEAEAFQRPKTFDLPSWWAASVADFQSALPKPMTAGLLVTADALARLKRMRYVSVDEGSVRLREGASITASGSCAGQPPVPAVGSAAAELPTVSADGSAGEPDEAAAAAAQVWLQAEVRFDTMDYAASVILSLAPGAAALSPPELRRLVRERALRAFRGHEEPQ
ncbi:helix-turn-helix transcriptional regulator [Paenibacillus sp. B01]|uniref:helix-turn-helix transcriptional regulator n=1 Tax=Paenibacillus sp. B01 TaxID=2660554 RepID=UPI00129AC189|nr:WYL domain-containing protein [Paenibacillus sp. B01]QGG57248.1 WYL domain-containing protein [Paenibacillus sp. B01]